MLVVMVMVVVKHIMMVPGSDGDGSSDGDGW